MTAVAHRIHQPELKWDWNKPFVNLGAPKDSYPTRENVDPTPSYTHPVGLVSKTLAAVEDIWPVDPAPNVFILPNELVTRANGWASCREWSDEPIYYWFVLSGKRIPIHPAMTRYLVAHEYGHIVEYDLLRSRGEETHAEAILEEYQEWRGGQLDDYGPGTWHTHTKEIFANDFRVLVAGVEEEFWPHDVPHPRDCEQTQQWWKSTAETRKAKKDSGS